MGIVEALQKVDLGNSPPCCCNQVRPQLVFSGVVTVSNPVSIHLKEFDGWEVRGLHLVVHMELGAEGGPLGVELVGAGVGDVTPLGRQLVQHQDDG